MKLYISPTSPYTRKVRILIRELGVLDKVEEVRVNTAEPDPEFADANPMGKVPTLIVEDQALCDSQLIIEYLQKQFSNDHQNDWAVKNHIWMAQGLIDCAYQWVMEHRKPDAPISDAILNKLQGKITKLLTYLDRHLPDMVQDQTYGITLGCALSYLEFREVRQDWSETAPHLADWFEKWKQSESVKQTAPE